MKNLLVFFLFLLATTICSAQAKIQVNKEGVYKLKADTLEWVDAEITAHPEALRYGLKISEAIQNPGEKILGERSEEILKLKPIFKKLVKVKEYFIVYNSQTKNIDYIEAAPIKREEPSYLILFSIASILLMVVSNILNKKEKDGFIADAFVAAVFVAAVFALVAAVFAPFAVFAATFAFAFAFAAAFVAVVFDDDKHYKVASIVFYILMAIHIFLLYI